MKGEEKKKLTFLLVFISSTLEMLARKKHLRRILHKVVKIALTTFSKIQLYIQPHWNNFLNLFIELRCSEIFIKLHYWLLHLSDLSVALIFVGLHGIVTRLSWKLKERGIEQGTVSRWVENGDRGISTTVTFAEWSYQGPLVSGRVNNSFALFFFGNHLW